MRVRHAENCLLRNGNRQIPASRNRLLRSPGAGAWRWRCRRTTTRRPSFTSAVTTNGTFFKGVRIVTTSPSAATTHEAFSGRPIRLSHRAAALLAPLILASSWCSPLARWRARRGKLGRGHLPRKAQPRASRGTSIVWSAGPPSSQSPANRHAEWLPGARSSTTRISRQTSGTGEMSARTSGTARTPSPCTARSCTAPITAPTSSTGTTPAGHRRSGGQWPGVGGTGVSPARLGPGCSG